MKRCPECRRDYFDDTLLYCLEDGSPLVQGSVPSPDLANTEILPNLDAHTRIFGADPNSNTISMSGYQPNSIAVLPFAHLSKDADDEYFCDGLAEELINALSRVDDLKVVARSSAFTFKGMNADVATVGATLGVENIVEGSVRKFGERMRINVSLTSTADGFNIWSDKYDTEMRDIFEVQDEITRSVVTSLKEKLLGRPTGQDDRMTDLIADLRHHAHDVESYQLYLRGRFLFAKFNEQDLTLALECFEKAIEMEPNFAEAYSGISDVYMWLTELGPIAPHEGMPKAKAASLKAIELDPDLSEAHTSLAIVLQEYEYDLVTAEAEYRRAIELNANNALAHQMLGALLTQLGRFPEGKTHFERSLELDPLSPMGSWIYPFGLFLARRYDDSIVRAEKILELDGNFAAAYLVLSFNYQMKGEVQKCADNYCRFLDLIGLWDVSAAARNGFADHNWEGFLRAMTAPEAKQKVTVYIQAVYFAALGELESAISCLERSYEIREGHMVMLNVDPRFDGLRKDERFRQLIEKIGFPEQQGADSIAQIQNRSSL